MRVKLEIGRCLHDDYHDSDNLNKAVEVLKNIIDDINNDSSNKIDDKLKSNIYCYYGMWRAEKIGNTFNENEVNNILKDLELSTKYNKDNYKAWHTYALLNYKFFESEKKLYTNYAINAIEGFSKSICIGGNNISKILQDLLLLINIWFQIGNEEYIDKLMNEKIDIISIQCWMLVIPQLLARINISNPLIRKTLILLLKKIGLKNPRRLTYPLTVLVNSKSKSRVEAVSLILEDIKKQHQQLFKECELIINELNRCALCLHEQWSEAIEEGAKLFFQSKDPKGSAKILMEQHQKMKSKPETMNEIHFYQMYKGNLNAAYKLVQDYLENNNITSFKEAWDIYHTMFRSI
jgi:FKBP12-rapamycin complex-associated protein